MTATERRRPHLGLGSSKFHFTTQPFQTFGQMRRFRDRTSLNVEPHVIPDAVGLDDEGVPFPVAGRIAVPRGVRMFEQRPAVEVDLAVSRAPPKR